MCTWDGEGEGEDGSEAEEGDECVECEGGDYVWRGGGGVDGPVKEEGAGGDDEAEEVYDVECEDVVGGCGDSTADDGAGGGVDPGCSVEQGESCGPYIHLAA